MKTQIKTTMAGTDQPDVILSIQGLSKSYGKVSAVSDLTLEITRGQVFGLLGPNGSGKSTTLGMILGAVNPSGGTYSWFGETGNHRLRRKIGAILEAPCFYGYLSAEQNLRIVCEIKKADVSRIDVVLERVGLLARKNDDFKTYSLGMKQRLAIASSLLSDPDVLILDEPTNGLDPKGIADIRELIVSLANEGRTIVLASHLLDEVQRICTDFSVLNFGKKIFQGKVSDLALEKKQLELKCDDREGLERFLNQSNAVVSFEKRGDVFYAAIDDSCTVTDFHRSLIDAGLVLSQYNQSPNMLEKKFLEILKTENHA
ncbi:MAG: ATP-binding cassette domain-containing protein [Flavobacteriales bacterium]|nr:ATP-binding cassette domain-containing protein [Flavobacteriales bacterium]